MPTEMLVGEQKEAEGGEFGGGMKSGELYLQLPSLVGKVGSNNGGVVVGLRVYLARPDHHWKRGTRAGTAQVTTAQCPLPRYLPTYLPRYKVQGTRYNVRRGQAVGSNQCLPCALSLLSDSTCINLLGLYALPTGWLYANQYIFTGYFGGRWHHPLIGINSANGHNAFASLPVAMPMPALCTYPTRPTINSNNIHNRRQTKGNNKKKKGPPM